MKRGAVTWLVSERAISRTMSNCLMPMGREIEEAMADTSSGLSPPSCSSTARYSASDWRLLTWRVTLKACGEGGMVRGREREGGDLNELQVLQEVRDGGRGHHEESSAGGGRDLPQQNEECLQHLVGESEGG
jgi:hypothetical protein